MAIGAIIVTSLSYALQRSSAEYICNAERFDKQSCPLCWFDHGDHSAYAMVSKTPCRRRRIVTNGLMCGSTVRKIHGVAIRKSK